MTTPEETPRQSASGVAEAIDSKIPTDEPQANLTKMMKVEETPELDAGALDQQSPDDSIASATAPSEAEKELSENIASPAPEETVETIAQNPAPAAAAEEESLGIPSRESAPLGKSEVIDDIAPDAPTAVPPEPTAITTKADPPQSATNVAEEDGAQQTAPEDFEQTTLKALSFIGREEDKEARDKSSETISVRRVEASAPQPQSPTEDSTEPEATGSNATEEQELATPEVAAATTPATVPAPPTQEEVVEQTAPVALVEGAPGITEEATSEPQQPETAPPEVAKTPSTDTPNIAQKSSEDATSAEPKHAAPKPADGIAADGEPQKPLYGPPPVVPPRPIPKKIQPDAENTNLRNSICILEHIINLDKEAIDSTQQMLEYATAAIPICDRNITILRQTNELLPEDSALVPSTGAEREEQAKGYEKERDNWRVMLVEKGAEVVKQKEKLVKDERELKELRVKLQLTTLMATKKDAPQEEKSKKEETPKEEQPSKEGQITFKQVDYEQPIETPVEEILTNGAVGESAPDSDEPSTTAKEPTLPDVKEAGEADNMEGQETRANEEDEAARIVQSFWRSRRNKFAPKKPEAGEAVQQQAAEPLVLQKLILDEKLEDWEEVNSEEVKGSDNAKPEQKSEEARLSEGKTKQDGIIPDAGANVESDAKDETPPIINGCSAPNNEAATAEMAVPKAELATIDGTTTVEPTKPEQNTALAAE